MRNLFLIISFCCCTLLFSQQEQQYSQYMLNQFALNPAIAGTEDFIDVILGGRTQWLGFESAPTTIFATAHMTLGKQYHQFHHRGEHKGWHGVGLQAFKDQTGPISRTSFLVAYAYNIPISSEIRLSTGAYFGMKQWSTNREKWKNIDDQSDYLFTTDLNSQALPDLHLGMSLYSPDFYVNFSAFSLLKNDLDVNFQEIDGEATLNRHYYLNGGIKLWLNDHVQITPSTMLKYMYGGPPSVDINTKLTHDDKFWYGFSYRIMDAANLFVGAEINHFIYASYAFEWSHSAIGKYIAGTHEIILGIRLRHPKNIDCPSKYW